MHCMNNTNIPKIHIIGGARQCGRNCSCRATDGNFEPHGSVAGHGHKKYLKIPLAGASPRARDAVEEVGGLHLHNRAATHGKI